MACAILQCLQLTEKEFGHDTNRVTKDDIIKFAAEVLGGLSCAQHTANIQADDRVSNRKQKLVEDGSAQQPLVSIRQIIYLLSPVLGVSKPISSVCILINVCFNFLICRK